MPPEAATISFLNWRISLSSLSGRMHDYMKQCKIMYRYTVIKLRPS